jgi:hypothetical protein
MNELSARAAAVSYITAPTGWLGPKESGQPTLPRLAGAPRDQSLMIKLRHTSESSHSDSRVVVC